jgi:hypothetical protein
MSTNAAKGSPPPAGPLLSNKATNSAALAQIRVAPPPAKERALDPKLAALLQLRGISSFGNRRAATINGRSLMKGESGAFILDGQTVRLRCTEVTEVSAVVDVDGLGKAELKLLR